MADFSSPGDGPRETQATEHIPSQPGGAAGSGRPSDPGLAARLRHDRRKPLRWLTGIAAALALGAGGVLAGSALSTASSPAASSAVTGPIGQAAILSAALSSAGATNVPAASGARSGGAASGPALAGGATAAARPCALARRAARAARLAGRLRLFRAARALAGRCRTLLRGATRFFLLNGVDGQYTFRNRQGLRTLAYERGVVQSVTPGVSLVVKASDGVTWTWSLAGDTAVRDGRGKVAESALSHGETVWVGGPVVGGARDARLIVLHPLSRPAGPAAPGGAAAPAPSASAPSGA